MIKYYFHIKKGVLKKLDIVNPFFRYFNNKQSDSLKIIDTLTFLFKLGKLESINFYNFNSFYTIQPALKNNCISDTTRLEQLSSSEKYYVPNLLYGDSMLIMFQKEYEFNDNITDYQKSLVLEYDSLKNFNRIVVISGYPTTEYPYNDFYHKYILLYFKYSSINNFLNLSSNTEKLRKASLYSFIFLL